jgi:hypothetical protein
MNKVPSTSNHKWNADRPVKRPEDDKLGRAAFAQRIARELSGWRQKDSLVISLNGDWGSGKTTLANLILFYAQEQPRAAGEKERRSCASTRGNGAARTNSRRHSLTA